MVSSTILLCTGMLLPQEKEEDKCYVSYTSNDLDDVNVVKNVYEDNSNVQTASETKE